MPRLVVAIAAISLCVLGCDPPKEGENLGIEKSKSIYDVKQKAKTEMSEEELKEARKKAGFKSQDEQLAEAKAMYNEMEKGFVKGRLKGYREMTKGLRAKLDAVEKQAPKWAKNEAAFTKWAEKYKEEVKEFKKAYSELSEKGTRGGDLQVEIATLLSQWDAFNGDLGPKISEAEGFKKTLEALRTKAGEIEKALDEIEKDESIEPEEAPEDDKGGKKKKKK